MIRRIPLGLALLMLLTAVCGASFAEAADTEAPANILVAFFSRSGENYNVGTVEKGNTHIVAEIIAQRTGGDLFHIQTVTPYPESYEECTEAAAEERRLNARPELNAQVEEMTRYDVIFLGYPIWWGDMPMAVYSFLESYDFSGKTIVPFCTHEGSGLADTVSSIADACPGATVAQGLAIRGQAAQNERDAATRSAESWLDGLGYALAQ